MSQPFVLWRRIRHGVLLILLTASALAQDVTSVEQGYVKLERFTQGLTSLQADFTQTVQDNRGQIVEKSSGVLAIQRPNKFRWDYRKPHEQVIVSDGERLWLYDPDLEQATVRRLEQSLAGTPAGLLAGSEDLRKSFEVERVEELRGWTFIDLTPKRADTDFKKVRLGLRDGELGSMALTDKLGQTTALEFSAFKRNPTLPAARFQFTPPSGVDVIGAAR